MLQLSQYGVKPDRPNTAIVLIVLLLACLFLQACSAQRFSAAYPFSGDMPRVRIVPYAPGFEELPLGSYRIPNTSFAINRYKDVSATVEAFSALGLAEDSTTGKADSAALAEIIKPALLYDLAAELEMVYRASSKHLGAPQLLELGQALDRHHTIDLQAWALIGTADGERGRLYLYLTAAVPAKQYKDKWWGRYIYYVPQTLVLSPGEVSVSDGSRPLAELIREGYHKLLDVFIMDLDPKRTFWDARQATVRLAVPGSGDIEVLDSLVLYQANGIVIFTPEAKLKSSYYGVHVVPDSAVVNLLR